MVPKETSEWGDSVGVLGFSIRRFKYCFILSQNFKVMGHPLSFGKFEIFLKLNMVTQKKKNPLSVIPGCTFLIRKNLGNTSSCFSKGPKVNQKYTIVLLALQGVWWYLPFLGRVRIDECYILYFLKVVIKDDEKPKRIQNWYRCACLNVSFRMVLLSSLSLNYIKSWSSLVED